MARGPGILITSCILLLVLASGCAKPQIQPVISLAELSHIPITPDHILIMNSGSVLIDGEFVVKDHWTDTEKGILWGVLEALIPTTDEPDSPILGGGPILTAKLGNQEVKITFFGRRSRMAVKKDSVVEKIQWFTYSAEDYQKVKGLIFPDD